MNAPTDYQITINSSNSDQSRSPGATSRLEGLINMNRDISQTDSDDAAKSEKQAMVPLHEDFAPGDDDVLCGRGKKCYAHTGNERFRQIVQAHLEQYSAASSRPEKSEILSAVVSQVRKNSPQGGFVKQDTATGKWFEVGDFLAREKTSQAFRDALHEHYRSSKKSKHEKRRQRTKARAMSEKKAAKTSPVSSSASRQEGPSPTDQQMLFPPLHASPLVSRQHLTVLREEIPHPRAYSFSGQTEESRLRVAPPRALSLSSGRGGGRPSPAQDGRPYSEPYHGADSAPSRYQDHCISLDEMAALRHDERMTPGHESWPQPYASRSHHMFSPPSYHASAPQFHPVRPEDIAAHGSYPDTDATMADAERVRPGSVPTPMTHWSHVSQHADMECDISPSEQARRASDIAQSAAYHAATPLGAYSSGYNVDPSASRYVSPQSRPMSAQHQHHRTDSTASATAIVAQLASALPPEPTHDENPFEPIPLGQRSKKPRTDVGKDQRKW